MPSYYRYDSNNYNPPAPKLKVNISTKLANQIKSDDDFNIKVDMLIDTGADVSCMPRNIISRLEKKLHRGLPYTFQSVEDFNGKKYELKVYKKLDISIAVKNKYFDHSVDFLEIGGEEGIIGRDILNDYFTKLNGPELKWSFN